MTTDLRIIECTEPLELHHRYEGKDESQGAYIELDLREGTLLASYNAEFGSAVPSTVFHGFERRYSIPILTASAANRTMAEIAPLAELVLADSKEEWDGSNFVARLGEDAYVAEREIEATLGIAGPNGIDPEVFDASDVVQEWDVESATDGSKVEGHGITASTTDARLEEIAAEILSGLGENAVCVGLLPYLESLRDDLAEEDPPTSAEVRTLREGLGLTGDHFAWLLGVNPRTVRSWEQGRDPVPGRIRPELTELTELTEAAVAAMASEHAGQDSPVLVTYRDEDEYRAAISGGRWSAAWHRRVCARAAAQLEGARIVYADDQD